MPEANGSRSTVLTGDASQLSWRYDIDWASAGGNSDRLRLKLTPDASSGGQAPEGHGMDLEVIGNWEAHELISVLQAVVHDLIDVMGVGWDVSHPVENVFE